MVDREGNEHQVTLYGVQEITQKINYVSVSSLASLFPKLENPDNILRPSGDVHLLIGLDHAAIHPRVIHTNGNLRLLSICFGSGSLLDGTMEKVAKSLGTNDPVILSLVAKYSGA